MESRPGSALAYPIALDLRGRAVLIVGGGAIAERKLRGLLDTGATLRLVAPAVTPGLTTLASEGRFTHDARRFTDDDCAGATLVFAATDDEGVNALVLAAARRHGALANDASENGRSDFATPTVARSGPITFAIDTGGLSPSLAVRLRDEVRERFGDEYGRAAQTLGRIRTYVTTVVPAPLRAETMRAFAAREIAALATLDPVRAEHEVEAFVEARMNVEEHPSPEALVCATRASALAMWQTRHVMGMLARAGLPSTVLQISTKGDRVQDRSLAALGTDSIFVKELELALRERRADFAVHSCKDLPSVLPDDMTLAAFGTRADARDAFCSERFASIDDLPIGARVGTSSPRRRAQLQALRPDLHFDIIRGNVDTRLRKLRDGEFDAILLAMAGLKRLDLSATYTVPLDPALIVPAVAQGALAIEVRAGEPALAGRIAAAASDPSTEIRVRAERAFLRAIRGGCQAPVGAYATLTEDTLTIAAAIAAVDGSRVLRDAAAATGDWTLPVAGPASADLVERAERLGDGLARAMLAAGGDEILGRTPDAGDDAAAGVPESPLAGRRFLLPRTQERPSRIAPPLRALGAEVVEAPDDDAATAAFASGAPDGLLFPSSGSVAAVLGYLGALRERGTDVFVAAMGPASAEAATLAGFAPSVVASEPDVARFVHEVTTHYLELEYDV